MMMKAISPIYDRRGSASFSRKGAADSDRKDNDGGPVREESAVVRSNRSDGGFTLVELMIALSVGLILIGAMYGVCAMQSRSFAVQEQVAEMQQNARAAMDIMTREIRMAGHDPLKTAGAGIVTAGAHSIVFTRDITSTYGADAADGDTADPDEYMTYQLYTTSGIQKLGRKSQQTAAIQPIAEHVQSLGFAYYDAGGATTATTADIRRIKIAVTVRTAMADPDYSSNGGYRTYTLTSVVTPRNLGL